MEKESDELLYTVMVTRYGPQSVASASGLTSCAEITCHARREFFAPKLQYFLSSKYINHI